jgi:hypothetical protein
MTIAVFEFMDKAPEEYSTDELLDCRFSALARQMVSG